MPITDSDFSATLAPNPLGVVLGMTGISNLRFSNTSSVDRGYNLSAVVTLPDGVSYVDSSVMPTSITDGPNSTIILTWTNIKDLAPNELDYNIDLTLKSDQFFRETGLPVTFDVPIAQINLSASVDTLPRGNDDQGNIVITKTDQENFIPLRYNLTKSGPGKIPKGAGLISPSLNPRWPYQYTLVVTNNSREPSTVTLIDNLPNGVRYLGNLNVIGPDSSLLSSPTITTPSPGPNCQDFVTLDWGSVILSGHSVNTITFDAAVWDNFTENCIENNGSRIPHMTPLENIATLDGLSGPVQANQITNAMDATINKSVASSNTDVGEVNEYTLVYRINQYDDVGSFEITDTISNGQSYNINSASITPDSITVNPDGTTTLFWSLGLKATGTVGSITFSTTTDSDYVDLGPVSSDDTLTNDVNIEGNNETTDTPTPDNSRATIKIGIPSIDKEILNYYYSDGTQKPFDVAAPGDEIEFRISYDSSNLTAEQRNIEIDEYAPLNMGPLDNLQISYGGNLPGPFNPFTVSPNGLRWTLGTLPGNTTWTATFRIPVKNIDFEGNRYNLAKLAGTNTENLAYSDRDQVEITFGKPNIAFDKTVDGPDVNAIKAGEIYTYSINISNLQNEDNTVVDAFEMDLTDVIPDGLTYNGNFNVTGSGIYDTPLFSGQNVSMTIKKLAPNESLTLSFEVTVDQDIVSGNSYTNDARLQRPYSQSDRSYQYPGDEFKDEVTLKAEGITAMKFITPGFVKIGDEVNYILEVIIPEGTTAYNVIAEDTYPESTQDYIAGSARKDNVPITPILAPGKVTFPAIPFVDATGGEVIITYDFKVRITDGDTTSPYVDLQTDTVNVKWDLDSSGTPATPFTTSRDLEVRTPHLDGVKEQRNVTKNTNFRTGNLRYDVGDVIEYRISLTNIGMETAYDTVLADVLNSFLQYEINSISTTSGSANESSGTITWNIPEIDKGVTATLTFRVTTLPGVGSDARIPDIADFSYNTNDNGFGIELGPDDTNLVRLVAPRVTIDKTASISQGEIGDDVTYTLTITVPEDTIAYTPQVEDTLPIGQTYIANSATRKEDAGPEVPVTPIINNQLITFPINPDIDATGADVVIVYKFTARITSATLNPPYQETQVNTGRVRWSNTSGGSLGRSATDTEDVLVRTPHIDIIKEQKRPGESYTTSNITGLPGEVITYKLTINSNGASPAFNINLDDILSTDLAFTSIVSGPTAGIVTPPASSPGGTLNWSIPQLDNGSSASLEFSVTIQSGIAASDTIDNSAAATYDSNDTNPITLNASSNTVTIDIPALELTKTSSVDTATIGDIITYNLRIDIPDGVLAYNLIVEDQIPIGQEYVPNSWTPGVAAVNGKSIVYTDTEPQRVGPLTLNFSFQTEVVTGTTVDPYEEIQRNIANILWDISPQGPKAPPVSSSKDVTIVVPHIVAEKEQRNVTTGGSFTKEPLLNVDTNDVIEYRITLTNDGKSTAYNIVTSDVLDNNLTYTGVVAPPPPGTVVSSVPPGTPDGTITWTEASLGVNSSLVLTFSVTVNAGPPPETAVLNQTSSLYDTDDINPTTLGPELSNIVSFNYAPPEILKTSDEISAFLGDTVTYTVKITIPLGNIAYDVQVTDILPTTQSYVANSLTRNGQSLTSPTLVFPFEGDIDARTLEQEITYTFKATIDSVDSTPEDIGTNTATINWNIESGGPSGTPQTDTTDVYVTDLSINLAKRQKNFTTDPNGPFIQDKIIASSGDIIHYALDVENPNNTTIYQVIVKDNLNNFLKYLGAVAPPPVGVVSHSGESSNGEFEWIIESIPPNTTYTVVIAVEVLPGLGAQSTIPNNSSVVFATDDFEPIIEYGPTLSNTVEIELSSLELIKSVSSDTVELGEIITYTLTLKVPKGSLAYNVIVSDTLPPEQSYIGEATRNDVDVFPNVNAQTVTFDTEPLIDATSEEQIIVYKFKARVVEGNDSPPYFEDQTNTTKVDWDVDGEGSEATEETDSEDINVTNPQVTLTKKQRNVTKNTAFEITEIAVEVGDIVEFLIEAESLGASPAYNVNISDILDPFVSFAQIESVSNGSADYDSQTNTVNWSIGEIPSLTTETLIFSVEILPGVTSGDTEENFAVGSYDSNDTNPITLGPIISNEVIHKYPNVEIVKTAEPQNVTIADIITYTVTFTIPLGTVVNNFQFTDILPVGQQYENNATLNSSPITTELEGNHCIVFPIIPILDATNNPITLIYKFDAMIISADVDPTTIIDIQRNTAEGVWEFGPEDAAPIIGDEDTVNITDSNIEIEKLERNVDKEENFTMEPTSGYQGQIIEYSLKVTNTGPNTIYDPIIEDILAPKLGFREPISVPTGTLSHSGEDQGGTVTWEFASLNPGQSVTAILSVEILSNIKGTVLNTASGSYRLTGSDPTRFGDKKSNTTNLSITWKPVRGIKIFK